MKSMFCLVIGMALLASVSAFSAQKSGVPEKKTKSSVPSIAPGNAARNETGGQCVAKGDDSIYQRNASMCASKTKLCKDEASQGISRSVCPPVECNQVASKGDTGSQSTTR